MQSDGQPRFPNGNGCAARPWAALGALGALLLAGLLCVPGCLNPRPEEEPSFQVEGEVPSPQPTRETCEDNALLAGCDAAPLPEDTDAIDAPSPPPAGSDPPSDAAPADAGAPGTGDAGSADAGTNAPGSSLAD
jgi:hypothetical protein